MVGNVIGYGGLRNSGEVVNMKHLYYEGKKDHVKKLWQKDPEKYF